RELVDHLDDLELVLPDYPAPYSGPVMHGMANGREHGTGRAVDVMVNNNTRAGDAVVAYVWKHRKRFDLVPVIWQQRIKSTAVPAYPAPSRGPGMHGMATGRGQGTGRAVGVMVNNHTRAGDAVVAYVWKHRKRFDLVHVTWQQRIKSTVVSAGRWRRMDDRGG